MALFVCPSQVDASHQESEALCLRRCIYPGAASHVFDAAIAQSSMVVVTQPLA